MIVVPARWSSAIELDGLVLVHPEGPDVAVLTFRERMRPLLKIGALLRAIAADDPSCAGRPRVERLVTDEGEHAALATFAGDRIQRDIGFVFGDDFYARLSAVCWQPERFAEITRTVRELVTTDLEMLGVRRRRFEYVPPATWQRFARGLITDWLAPAYPRDTMSLTVYPALPVDYAPDDLLASMLVPRRSDAESLDERVVPIELPNGLAGQVGEATWTSSERRVAKLCGVLRDRRYAYPLEATAIGEPGLAAHREAIEGVLASIQPIPQVKSIATSVAANAWGDFWIQ